MRYFWCLLLCLFGTDVFAQIKVNDSYKPFERVIIECDIDWPESGEVKFIWSTPTLGPEQLVFQEQDSLIYAWPQPGTHPLDVIVITQVTEEIEVPVLDKDDPKNLDKMTFKTIKVSKNLDVSRYKDSFKVVGKVPEPDDPPGPEPDDPDPLPVSGFAAEVRKWAKALPANVYNKQVLLEIGDNYLSVGSQGSDPARNQGWNLDAFRTKTRDLNLQVFNAHGADVLGWEPLMRQLAQYQADLYAQRGLRSTDVAKIAALWSESGEALKEGAF